MTFLFLCSGLESLHSLIVSWPCNESCMIVHCTKGFSMWTCHGIWGHECWGIIPAPRRTKKVLTKTVDEWPSLLCNFKLNLDIYFGFSFCFSLIFFIYSCRKSQNFQILIISVLNLMLSIPFITKERQHWYITWNKSCLFLEQAKKMFRFSKRYKRTSYVTQNLNLNSFCSRWCNDVYSTSQKNLFSPSPANGKCLQLEAGTFCLQDGVTFCMQLKLYTWWQEFGEHTITFANRLVGAQDDYKEARQKFYPQMASAHWH